MLRTEVLPARPARSSWRASTSGTTWRRSADHAHLVRARRRRDRRRRRVPHHRTPGPVDGRHGRIPARAGEGPPDRVAAGRLARSERQAQRVSRAAVGRRSRGRHRRRRVRDRARAAQATLEYFDVGWVRIESPLYKRPYGQPRLFRARPGLEYRGRHHWIYRGDELLATHQYGGLAEHAAVPITIRNARGLGHDNDRANAKRMHALVQSTAEHSLESSRRRPDRRKDTAREALRIVQVAKYDAGLAVSRLHTALNATTPHASVYVHRARGRPYGAPGQHRARGRRTLMTRRCRGRRRALPPDAGIADAMPSSSRPRRSAGAASPRLDVPRGAGLPRAIAEHYRALVLVSTLELLQYGPAEWLPNPMPVARYRRLREERVLIGQGRLPRRALARRSAHLKGTDDLPRRVRSLRARGIPIEPVLIENMEHGEGSRSRRRATPASTRSSSGSSARASRPRRWACR
jgi:hypothetical protein